MAGITRGDIWLLDLGLAQKTRPAVILSIGYLDDERALITYVPRTTSLRGSRFEIIHRQNGFTPGGFDAQSIGTIPVAKLMRRIATLDFKTLSAVEERVRLWLNL